jgi:hypothetical protein
VQKALLRSHGHTILCRKKGCGALVDLQSARTAARRAGRDFLKAGDGCASACCSAHFCAGRFADTQLRMAEWLLSGERVLVLWPPTAQPAVDLWALPRARELAKAREVLSRAGLGVTSHLPVAAAAAASPPSPDLAATASPRSPTLATASSPPSADLAAAASPPAAAKPAATKPTAALAAVAAAAAPPPQRRPRGARGGRAHPYFRPAITHHTAQGAHTTPHTAQGAYTPPHTAQGAYTPPHTITHHTAQGAHTAPAQGVYTS